MVYTVWFTGPLNFTFTPASNRNGSVTVDTYVKNQESESWDPYNTDIMVSHSQTSFDVVAVADGFTITTNSSSGNEDTLIPIDVTISDPDSSEILTSLTIDKVPNGFLVFYGDDANSATLAQNIGVKGQMSMQIEYGVDETVNYNLWNIPLSNGQAPHIYIKAPENWSGTIPGVQLHTVDDSGHTSNLTPFDITINPVVDNITINPTKTFGDKGSDIPININANVDDLDGSETVTLTLKGLGEGASFKDNGVEIDSTHISYDSGSDTYTIDSIAASDINALSFVQSNMTGTVDISAKMVESDGSQSSVVSGQFNVNINQVVPTNGDDNLLYSGNNIDALGGNDTVSIKSGESIDFSKLHNIEKIDLTQNGDHNIGTITLNDVVNMTDDNNTLVIDGDSGDKVVISGLSSSDTETIDGKIFDIYTNSGDPTVTLKIEHDIVHS